MTVTLSDRERRLLALFESETGAAVRDCVVDDDHDQVIFTVKPGEMADAIGPGGEHVRRIEDRLDARVKLVEDAETAETFVANALEPAAVYNVTVSENDSVIAYAEVDQNDVGAAIGADGRNIDAARRLARRHFGIDDVELV